MGALWSCFCRCRGKKSDPKKKDDMAVIDIEGGSAIDEVWDDWEPDAARPAASTTETQQQVEQQPPEEDPFADLGMTPVVTKTRRHNAVRLARSNPCKRSAC